MKLNKYLFNRVNNKERERGQRSVVWLKRGQPCLHRLHVLSTVFSWRPFSSFSLWIILLPVYSVCIVYGVLRLDVCGFHSICSVYRAFGLVLLVAFRLLVVFMVDWGGTRR